MKRLIKFLIFGSLLTTFCFNQSVDAWTLFKTKKEDKNKSDDKQKTKEKSNKSTSADDKAKQTSSQQSQGLSSDDNEKSKNVTDDTKSKELNGHDEPKEQSQKENKANDEKPSSIIKKAVSDINKKDATVVFNDGSIISQERIDTELKKLPLEVTSRIPYQQLLQYLSFRETYMQIINTEAEKLKLADKPEVKKSIEERCNTFVSAKYLDEQVEKIMTDDELKKYYDETFEKNIKGTQEISCILINVKTKEQADRIIKEVKNEEQLKKIASEYKGEKQQSIAMTPLDDYNEKNFPVDIAKQIKAKGVNSIVGPINIQGMQALIFIKSIHPAVKKPFSEEIKTIYKQIGKMDFSRKYISKLLNEKKVTIYDLHGKPVDFDSNKKKEDKSVKKDEKPVDLSKIKEDFVIAKIGDKQTIKMSKVYEMYNVSSLENDAFYSIHMQLNVPIEEVIQSAIKVCVQDELINQEVEKSDFSKRKDIVEELEKIKAQQLRRAYCNFVVKITDKDARKQYNKYIQLMKKSDKDDQEISVRLMFYKTKDEADTALKKYQSSPREFSTDYEKLKKESKPAVDLGFIRKQNPATAGIWEAVKTSVSATCCKQVVKVNGGAFGYDGYDYAVAYVGERRPVKLPTFEECSAFFRKVAEKMQMVSIISEMMANSVESICGIKLKQLKEQEKNGTDAEKNTAKAKLLEIDKVLTSIVTDDTERSIGG